MKKSLHKQARRKVMAKKSFFAIAIIFATVSSILLLLSFKFWHSAFYFRLPIIVMAGVLGTIYVSMFGLPVKGIFSSNWEDDEVEKEMIRLYRKKRLAMMESDMEEIYEEEGLELEELERMEREDSILNR